MGDLEIRARSNLSTFGGGYEIIEFVRLVLCCIQGDILKALANCQSRKDLHREHMVCLHLHHMLSAMPQAEQDRLKTVYESLVAEGGGRSARLMKSVFEISAITQLY